MTPVLGADGTTINLSLNPERSFLKAIAKWGEIPTIKLPMPVEQPDIVTRSVITNIAVKSGVTVLLATYDRYEEEDKKGDDDIELMLLTATTSK